MASRQERRKAERDAAKRAPAQAGAGGAAGAAGAGGVGAARADVNVNVNPVGDWTTQTENFLAVFATLTPIAVKWKADEGDRNAQYSLGQGFTLVHSQLNVGAFCVIGGAFRGC